MCTYTASLYNLLVSHTVCVTHRHKGKRFSFQANIHRRTAAEVICFTHCRYSPNFKVRTVISLLQHLEAQLSLQLAISNRAMLSEPKHGGRVDRLPLLQSGPLHLAIQLSCLFVANFRVRDRDLSQMK